MVSELSLAEQYVLQEHMLNLNLSLCDVPVEMHNISNLSALCSSNHPPSTLPPPVMSIIQIFYGLICLLGLLGNSLVIYVVLRFSKMHTVTNMYILNLAIADETFLVGIPFLIATMSLREWPFGTIMCKVYFTTTSINQITSSIFLTVLSADRYIAVCHPISSPRFRTPFIARIVSLSAWLTSALLMVPVFLYANTITRPDGGESCNIFWTMNITSSGLINEQTAFTFYSFIFGFAGPLTFIFIFYILVIIRLRSVGPKGADRSQSKRKAHRKVTKLVLTVVAVYILCWLPHWITQLALVSQPPGYQSETIVVITLLSNCLSYSNSAMNPVLYAFLSDNFKKSFVKACSKSIISRCATARETNHQLNPECSATTRRSRRGPRFTAVPPGQESGDEERGGGDMSTGVTLTSRASKFNGSSSSAVGSDKPQIMTTVFNGNLAPPTIM
ncbi:somatostatin receptor type 2 isoform X2 [Eurytemora carolleeae]|uniref:somatostatin receptor type 2 isoform X2 n=1 Tax=Eurytemora carolleeae TaxID=1294199 RepID=UPI000C774871|nr:somatostatin receptor type 2 isoform X2 [Eurytemora carolleeae]|eukprot:XP_023343124.1 somatostatin receptor type 2-like isoform X2 [Eurytemora affinis]